MYKGIREAFGAVLVFFVFCWVTIFFFEDFIVRVTNKERICVVTVKGGGLDAKTYNIPDDETIYSGRLRISCEIK